MPALIKVTPAQREAWRTEYEQEGLTIQELSARHGISYGTMHRHLKAAGTEFRSRNHRSINVQNLVQNRRARATG